MLEARQVQMVDRKAADEAAHEHLKVANQVQGLRDSLEFVNEKVKLVEGQLAEATKEADAPDEKSPSSGGKPHPILQSLMKTLDRAKKTFVLMEARLNRLEREKNQASAPAAKEGGEMERPQIGVKRAKLD